MTKPRFVYVTYIRTTPEKLWAALTDPQTIRKFWFRAIIECDWKPGSPWRLNYEDGRAADTGVILEAVPHKRLVIANWQNQFNPEVRAAGHTRCTIEIEIADYYPNFGGEAVKLTITHEAETEQGQPMIDGVAGGWPKILSNLKSLLETGDIAFAENVIAPNAA